VYLLFVLPFQNSDNLMELLLMIDAAKRASARHITAVYFTGQDKIERQA
jgi:phosphoribosylpyrophosphate synthetase